MRLDRNKSRAWRVSWVYGVLFVALMSDTLSASCVSELNRIVKTARGIVRDPKGNAIRDAQITVISSSEDEIFQTKSGRDGSFHLRIKPGKYRVEVEADVYLRLDYIIDLRSEVTDEPIDISLQSAGECHDMHLAREENSEQIKCSSEVLPPNLILKRDATLSGHVRDETGARFKNSEVILRKLSDSTLEPAYLISKTDDAGAFTFDEAEPGPYRLLASPSRAFAQPANLDCYEMRDCNLEIILKANGTDLPYAGCPVR